MCRADRSLLWLALSLVAGLVLGLALPRPAVERDPAPWAGVSWVLGWTYFMCWSVSFWPQIVLNYRRKSTAGLSFEFQLLNFVGFSCYAAFNCALFWSPGVRLEYARRNGGHASAVRFNDVLFALHALLATVVTLAQIFLYGSGGVEADATAPELDEWSSSDYPVHAAPERGLSRQSPRQKPRLQRSFASRNLQRAMYVTLALFTLAIAILIALCAVDEGSVGITWLDVLYVLSSAKVVITVIKYIPQVWENWRRQSTEGWNIWNVLLDLSGALGSFGQLVLDCASTGVWSGLTGDPAKLMLSNVSLVFDAVFIVQHYCLYGGGGEAGRSSRSRGGGRVWCCCCRSDDDEGVLEPLNQDIDWMAEEASASRWNRGGN